MSIWRILALVFICLIISIPIWEANVHHPDPNFASDLNIRSYPIEDKTVYICGNFTANTQNKTLLSNHILIFVGNGTHNLWISDNLTIQNESIQSNYGMLNVENTMKGIRIRIDNTIFRYHGIFSFNNSTLNIQNSIFLGGHIRAKFSYDHIIVRNSSLNTTSTIANYKRSYQVGSICKNGQPSGGYLPVNFTFRKGKFSQFPINFIILYINYTASSNENISISLKPSGLSKINENLSLLKERTGEKFQFSLKKPLYANSIRNNTRFWGYINATSPENITIWSTKILLNSTSQLNFTGVTHNYILFSHSDIVLFGTIVNGLSGNYSVNGILNINKTGIIGANNSSLIIIDSSFMGWGGYLNQNNSPIVLESGSEMKMFKPLIIGAYMHNLRKIINLKNSTITGNQHISVQLPEKYYSVAFNKSVSGYVMVLNMSQRFETFRFLNFSVFGRDYYFTISASRILEIPDLEFNVSLNFTSQVLADVSTFYNSTSINVQVIEHSFYNDSWDVYSDYSISYDGISLNRTSFLNLVSAGSLDRKNLTLPRYSSFNATRLSAFIIIKYFNGVTNITYRLNISTVIPPHYYNYSLTESGLPKNTTWRVFANNTIYNTSGNCMMLHTLSLKLKVEVMNTSLYHPKYRVICFSPGKAVIQFVRTYGLVHIVILSNVDDYNIIYDNQTFHFSSNNITVKLPYGRTPLKLEDKYGARELNVTLYQECERIFISLPGTEINYFGLTTYFIVILAMVMSSYLLIKRTFYSFCPYCMEIVRPFGIHGHHCDFNNRKKVMKDKNSKH